MNIEKILFAETCQATCQVISSLVTCSEQVTAETMMSTATTTEATTTTTATTVSTTIPITTNMTICQGTQFITNSSFPLRITTPNHPQDYSPNEHCILVIDNVSGVSLSLTFEKDIEVSSQVMKYHVLFMFNVSLSIVWLSGLCLYLASLL